MQLCQTATFSHIYIPLGKILVAFPASHSTAQQFRNALKYKFTQIKNTTLTAPYSNRRTNSLVISSLPTPSSLTTAESLRAQYGCMPATVSRRWVPYVIKRANTINTTLFERTKSSMKWNSEKSNDSHERNDDSNSENCQTTVLVRLANSLIKI